MIPIRDTVPSRTVPVVTCLLITLNLMMFVYELTLPAEQVERFFYHFGVVPARYSHPEWARWAGMPLDNYWPFLTSMFLHGGWLHIIGNMWILWIFGDNVEDRMGHVRFLAFYLLTGLVAGLTHWLTNLHSTVPTVGASGAIAGVLGAYFILIRNSRVLVLLPVLIVPLFFELPAALFLLLWFGLQLLGGAFAGVARPEDVGGIAWWAHIGGFMSGVLLHRLFIRPRSPP